MKRILTAALAVAAALVVGAQADAHAANVHYVQTADSPSTGAPIAGGGTWIVNKPSGYYLGRQLPGWEFDNQENSGADWHYGRARSTINMCGWAMPGSLGSTVGSTPDSCSADTKATLSHRLTFGRDYNAAAHQATDGSTVPANTGCTFYLNYFYGTDFTANGGHWANATGHPGGTVQYRFTTRDRQAVVVRDSTLGWGFLPIGCVTRPGTLYNDND